MDEDVARIRLKIGAIEIEYEGGASFLRGELVALTRQFIDLHVEHKDSFPAIEAAGASAVRGTAGSAGDFDHSTNTIAGLLDAKSCSDLAIAAAGHLALARGQDKFTRRELDAEMRGATTYFSKNMSSNLSKAINTLVKAKRLNQVGNGLYALSANEKKSLEAVLARSG